MSGGITRFRWAAVLVAFPMLVAHAQLPKDNPSTRCTTQCITKAQDSQKHCRDACIQRVRPGMKPPKDLPKDQDTPCARKCGAVMQEEMMKCAKRCGAFGKFEVQDLEITQALLWGLPGPDHSCDAAETSQ